MDEDPRCAKIMNNGNVCGRRATDHVNGVWCCGRHSRRRHEQLRVSGNHLNYLNAVEEIPVYAYPANTLLNNLPNELPRSEQLESNNDYINFRLQGVFLDQEGNPEDIPLVMMNEPVTPHNLARYIADTIAYFETRPDVYKMNGKLDDYIIQRITYNMRRGIYMVYMKKQES